jgi:hypothetical protein
MSKGNVIKKSRESAEATLRRLFAGNPDSDTVTVEEIVEATGRHAIDMERNKAWISSKMSVLRYYNLALPVYTYDNRKRLERVRLTAEGKRALRQEASIDSNGGIIESSVGNRTVSLDDALKVVNSFRKENPDYEVVFNVTLKDK